MDLVEPLADAIATVPGTPELEELLELTSIFDMVLGMHIGFLVGAPFWSHSRLSMGSMCPWGSRVE